MRKLEIPKKYDEESYIEGYHKGWGACLASVIRFTESVEKIFEVTELKEAVLKHKLITDSIIIKDEKITP